MTDILSRLAALTAKDEEMLKKPYPFCGSICGSAKHGEDIFWWRCDHCNAEGPEEERHPNAADPDWNTRPREQALIALVEEAAQTISTLEWAIGCKDKQILEFSDAINDAAGEIERLKLRVEELIIEHAFDSQEPTP